MLTQVFQHTPKWVYLLFATLLWLGAKQLLAGSVSLARVTLMPIAMTGLAVAGIAAAFGDAPLALLVWCCAALVSLGFVMQRSVAATTRYDAAARRFQHAGSAVPLLLMMGIFFTKYSVGVLLAMHPELAREPGFALGISALYGLFTGVFTGRAMRLWKLAIGTARARTVARGAGA